MYSVRIRSELPPLLVRLGLCGAGAEIGVEKGGYSRSILAGSGLQKLYSVDPWREFPAGAYRDQANVSQVEHNANFETTRAALALFGDRSVVLRELSEEAAKRFADGALDFVYIDANHSYGGCAEDIALWWPKVREGGVFAGHDYLPDGLYEQGEFGVKRAVDEFAARYGQTIRTTTDDLWPTWWCIKS